jgi:putative Mg2+ transporter-C (MgtC) family protein
MLAASVPTLGVGELTLRLVIAAVLGGIIGLEREYREREAGLRTHMLVSVGSALFTIISAYGFTDFYAAGPGVARIDPTRIAAQIVTGVGFLGAGAIIRQGLTVRGLTTAATLWLVAAIGMASGAGYWSAALIATGGALFSLGPLRIASHRVVSRFRPDTGRLVVELPGGMSPASVVDAIEDFGGRLETMLLSHEGDRRRVELDVQLHNERQAHALVATVSEVEGVLAVRWAD